MSGSDAVHSDEVGGTAVRTASPGTMLKIARERAGLGVDDLAAQLKLSRNALEALEGDDFGSLSEPVYVRGYYRKVAKTLGMSEDEVLDAYSALQPSGSTPIRTSETPLTGGVDSSMARRGQGQGLLLAGLIVVISVALLVTFSKPQRPEPLASKPEPSPVQAAPVASDPEAVADSASATADEQAEPAAEPELRAEVAAPEPAAPEPEPAPAPAPPPAAAAGQIPDQAISARPNQLVLHFAESSFVRIEDAGGRTLLIGLVRAGETPVLDGEPPYSVFLGNAGNVRAFHGGKGVDFSGSINRQNQTARFTVP